MLSYDQALKDQAFKDLQAYSAEINRLRASNKELLALLDLWCSSWRQWGMDPQRSDTFDEAWGRTRAAIGPRG